MKKFKKKKNKKKGGLDEEIDRMIEEELPLIRNQLSNTKQKRDCSQKQLQSYVEKSKDPMSLSLLSLNSFTNNIVK